MKTQTPHTIGSKGLDLIKNIEKLRLKAYLCSAGRLTWGYGHVILPQWDFVVLKAMTAQALTQLKNDCEQRGIVTREAQACLFINETQANAFLNGDTQLVVELINSIVHVELSQNQFDALCCLTFNIGQSNFTGSTLRKKLNSGDINGAAEQFDVWIKETVNGKKQVSNGLVNRRAAERALFESA